MSCHASGQSLRLLFCRPHCLLFPFLLMLKTLGVGTIHAQFLRHIDHTLFSSAHFSCSTAWGKYYGDSLWRGWTPLSQKMCGSSLFPRSCQLQCLNGLHSSLFADPSVRCSLVSGWSGGSIPTLWHTSVRNPAVMSLWRSWCSLLWCNLHCPLHIAG